MEKLFCDCKTDAEKSAFFLSGRAVETGVIAAAISNDVAMAYHRCDEFKKEVGALQAKSDTRKALINLLRAEIDALSAKIEAMEQQEPVWFIDERGEPKRYHKSKADYCKYGGLDLLYALPGAKGE